MGLKLITPPSAYPVTVAQAKAHMRVEHSEDDAMIERLIATAVEGAELRTGRQLVTAQYDHTLNRFPPGTRWNPLTRLDLPRTPLQSVVAVYYLDTDGVEQQLACGAYTVDDYSLVPGLYPVAGTSWPATFDGPNAVRVRFTCGWAMDDGTSPPAWTGPPSIASWILVMVATMYEQREALVLGQTVAELPRSHVDGLLDSFVIPKVV